MILSKEIVQIFSELARMHRSKIALILEETIPVTWEIPARCIFLNMNHLSGFNMEIGIKCFIGLIVVAMTSICVSASDTTSEGTVMINNTPYSFLEPLEADSTNYLVVVGPYELGFSIASSDFFEYGYKTTYYSSPQFSVGEDYNLYGTSLRDDNGSIIDIWVREFKYPVSKNAQNLESETIGMYGGMLYGSYGLRVAEDHLSGYKGVIIDWHSDKTEIIIHGTLKRCENWRDIRGSVNLIKKQDLSKE